MKRSPGPTPSSPLTTKQGQVGVGQLALDPVLHPLGQHVARPLHAGQVDEDELAAGLGVGGDAANRPPRRLRAHRDDRHVAADDRVDQGRLADVGPTGETDEASARHAQPRHHPRLQREHLAVVGLVVVAAEVQDAVDGRLDHVGAVLGADRHVAQLARAGVGPAPSSGKARTSVGASLPRCSRFSSRIRAASTSSTARWPSVDRRGAQRRRHGVAQLGGHVGEVNATSGGGRSSLPPLGVLAVGRDDPLHQLVADDVLAAEADEGDVLHLVEDVAHDDQAGALVGRQVDLGDVAGDDHPRVEAEPGQEHLHLLGAGVLRLVEDHEGVVEGAAAHEGERRHLDHAALEVAVDPVGVEHVVERVEERPQVGVDLGLDVAGQEAEPLAGLDRRAGEDDPLHLALGQRVRRPSPPRGRSCRCPRGRCRR